MVRSTAWAVGHLTSSNPKRVHLINSSYSTAHFTDGVPGGFFVSSTVCLGESSWVPCARRLERVLILRPLRLCSSILRKESGHWAARGGVRRRPAWLREARAAIKPTLPLGTDANGFGAPNVLRTLLRRCLAPRV
jgi:hypothetical protein